MILIGIHGAIGHGKTTLADMFTELEPRSIHLESSQVIAEVLNKANRNFPRHNNENTVELINIWFKTLPAILQEVVHVDTSYERLKILEDEVTREPLKYQKLLEYTEDILQNPGLLEQTITVENKFQYRAGLQGLGGFLVTRVGPTIWYDELLNRAKQASESGTELAVIGGLRYPADGEVVRKGGGMVIEIYRPDTPSLDINDPTEQYRSQIITDSRVVNSGTLDDLRQTSSLILDDIRSNNLAELYKAKPAKIV